MVCFSAIIEREPLWARGVRPPPNTAMEPTNGAAWFRRQREVAAPFAAHRRTVSRTVDMGGARSFKTVLRDIGS